MMAHKRGNLVMKKLILFLIISCYSLLIYFILKEFNIISALPDIGIILLFIITIALAIANIVNGILSKNKLLISHEYCKSILVFKLIMIPFFILNFLMWYMAMALVFLFGGFLLIPIGIAFTYIILLSSSAYVISELHVWYKNKEITPTFLIIHLILQLLFVADIIDYIYVYQTLNKVHKNE
jgi:hypothetical protein